jgi:hypothetical protein
MLLLQSAAAVKKSQQQSLRQEIKVFTSAREIYDGTDGSSLRGKERADRPREGNGGAATILKREIERTPSQDSCSS